MSYDNASKQATMKYIKEKQQEIKVRYKKEEYESDILPAIEQSGLPVATFIKQAVSEKIVVETNRGYDLEITLETVKNSALKKLPEIMKDDCKQIILYGSCARGDYSADSDVDIAILTGSDREQVKKYGPQLDELATQIGIDTMAVVNFICLPQKEYEDKKSWYPFFKNIAKDGIVLYER